MNLLASICMYVYNCVVSLKCNSRLVNPFGPLLRSTREYLMSFSLPESSKTGPLKSTNAWICPGHGICVLPLLEISDLGLQGC